MTEQDVKYLDLGMEVGRGQAFGFVASGSMTAQAVSAKQILFSHCRSVRLASDE